MGKTTLAARLANKFGSTTEKAGRFIDDVGPNKARALDDLAPAGDDASKSGTDVPWKTLIGGGAVAGTGGGYLYYREQDVNKAQAAAEQADSYEETVQGIIESDLPSALKRDLADGAAKAANGDFNQGGSDGNPIDGTTDFLGDLWPGDLDLDVGTIVLILLGLMLAYTYFSEKATRGVAGRVEP